ncbi:MAG: S-layer homology domain-containing protein [Aphanocapsa sp. GSE-SYN-MK-11-07L]|nr:S-layer homology domain-containing protein [Aphanocapsa sp. GSE-SYN-MK-11-07L]
MTHSPPPNPPPPKHEPLGFDDFVGIFVAFISLGAVVLWAFTQNNQAFNFSLVETAPALRPAASPAPSGSAPPVSGQIASPAVPIPASPQPLGSPQLPKVIPVVPLTALPSGSPLPRVSASPQAIAFPDLPPNFWASPFIAELARRDLLVGFPDRTYRPNQPVTRAEFATMLQKGFEQPKNSRSLKFNDLGAEFWANSAINEAVQMDFMAGYPGNTFRPEQSIPKIEALTALANGLNLPAPSAPTDTLSLYQDANQIPDYALKPVAAATTAGLVVNYPDHTVLNPQQIMTRADAAALIYQALAHSGKVDPLNSAYIVRP